MTMSLILKITLVIFLLGTVGSSAILTAGQTYNLDEQQPAMMPLGSLAQFSMNTTPTCATNLGGLILPAYSMNGKTFVNLDKRGAGSFVQNATDAYWHDLLDYGGGPSNSGNGNHGTSGPGSTSGSSVPGTSANNF